MINPLKILLSVLFLGVSTFSAFASQYPDETPDKATLQTRLESINHDFTYRGRPLNPRLLQALMPAISDPNYPTLLTVDIVKAFNTNQFFVSKIENHHGIIEIKEDSGSSFGYKWLGQLKNGMHVLETFENTGGSGTFENLIFVEFSLSEGYSEEGDTYPQLLMSIKRIYSIGDRTYADFHINGNSIIAKLRESSDNKERTITLSMP